MNNTGTLTFFCGKMGAGKSTYSQKLASETGAILLSEDDWLAALYPDEIKSLSDYQKYSARLKPLLASHLQATLLRGISVVLDFPGNTRQQRLWFKEIVSCHNIPHRLVYLEMDDSSCLLQIGQRRLSHPERTQFDTDAIFHQVTAHFETPATDEGFDISIVRRTVA